MHLEPLYLYLYVQKNRIEDLEAAHVMDCIECGACSYICPGRLHLTHSFKVGKQKVKEAAAKAKASYLKGLKGLKNPKQVTLLIPGTVNFADGKGAAQVRKDFGRNAGDELAFCTDPNGKSLTNSGSETVNKHTEPTNEPQICG